MNNASPWRSVFFERWKSNQMLQVKDSHKWTSISIGLEWAHLTWDVTFFNE